MGFLKRLCTNFYVLALASFVSGLISVYDNVMNVVFFETLPENEQNPVASWIIEKIGVAGLVEIKALGTILAVAIMIMLAKTKYRTAIWAVLFFQALLFCYITFYTPSGILIKGDFFMPIKFFFKFCSCLDTSIGTNQ